MHGMPCQVNESRGQTIKYKMDDYDDNDDENERKRK